MRRDRVFMAGWTAALALAVSAQAQDRPAPQPLVAHPLKGGAYWVEGGGSNTGFIVGDKGVIAIDALRSPDAARRVLAEIAKVTPKPVNYVVATHSDPDHVGGLPAFAPGTPIAAQENTRSTILLSAAAQGNPTAAVFKALIPGFLPTELVADRKTVIVDGVRMVLMHVAPAHGSGDLIVYLPAQKIVFAGDVLTSSLGRYPVIHIGGSSLGWIETVRAMLALDADTFVSGHGGIETKAALRTRLADVEQRREQIKALVYQNKTLPEVKQALSDEAPAGPPGAPRFPTFVETTYAELATGYPPGVPPWTNFVR